MTDEEVLVQGLQVIAQIIAREIRAEIETRHCQEEKTEPRVDPEIQSDQPSASRNLVTAEDVAEYLNLPRSSIWGFTRSGKIPHYRIGSMISTPTILGEQK